MKVNKKTVYVSVIASLLSLFTACDMAGDLESAGSPGNDGKAAIRVQIGTGDSIQERTVRPVVALQDVTAWELRGRKQGGTETLLAEFSNGGESTVFLEPAVWNFTLTGYKDNAVILTGSIAEQTISLEGTNILDFTVAPVSEGEGTINLVIELPDGSGITAARVFKDGTELASPITPVDGKIIVAGTYAAGTYRFVIRLYKDSDLYGVISEAVYVQANLQSEKTYTLSAEDLKLIYVITYHLGNGETATGYFKWTDAITLSVPSRTGYVFEGWYENEALSGQAVTVIPIGSAGDKDFYAKWTIIQYTVTFDADGGSPGTQTKTADNGDAAMTFMYNSVSSGTWTLLDDGRRESPAIGNNT